MKSLETRLKNKNKNKKWEYKEYVGLPQAFNKKKIYDVIESLKRAGYTIFDYYLDGKEDCPIHIARKHEKEIYFNNEEAVCTVCDYGDIHARVFHIALEGNYVEGIVPQNTWVTV